MINADDTAYQKIDKKSVDSPLSELINRRHSIETANPPSSYFDKESNEIQHKKYTSSVTTMPSMEQKISSDDIEDDQIPPFLKNF